MNGNKYKILIIEDDEHINNLVATLLEANGYQALSAYSCEDGMMMYASHRPDLVVLDLGLPDQDGMTFLKRLRKDSLTPVIVLSARSDEKDKVEALDMGANDYVTKPFNPLELVARAKSQLRRYTQLGSTVQDEKKEVYEVGGLSINDELKEVTVDGESVRLTPIEYNILLLLVKNQGKVFSIDQIYENIWNEEAIGADNTVAVHIRHIREKIEINPKEPRYLKVVWGVGYKIEKL